MLASDSGWNSHRPRLTHSPLQCYSGLLTVVFVFWFLKDEGTAAARVSTHLRLLSQQLIFHRSLFLYRHSFLVLFEILSFPGLKVEPRVSEGTNLRQQSLDKRMEFILKEKQRELRTASEASHLGGGRKGKDGPRGRPETRLELQCDVSTDGYRVKGQRRRYQQRSHLLLLPGDAEFVSQQDLAPAHTGSGTTVYPVLDGAENCPFLTFLSFASSHVQRKPLKHIRRCVANLQHGECNFELNC